MNAIARYATLTLCLLLSACAREPVAKAETAQDKPAAKLIQVRMSIDEDAMLPHLAEGLGYIREQGLEIVPVKVEDYVAYDYLIQEPLNKGQIDASYHWFHHAVFGARHNLPVKAVMLFNDAPGMTVMVANRVKDRITSAADLKGAKVAEGAGYGTKSVLTGYLAKKAGLPPRSYTPVLLDKSGRQEAILEGLKAGEVDVVTSQEPITSVVLASGLTSTLYDLNSRESITKVLGAAWPSQSLLVSQQFVESHPDVVQRLVNAFVKTMNYVNSHGPEQIAEQLPAAFFDGKDAQAEIELIRKTLPTYARGNYSFSGADVQLLVHTIEASSYDGSEEGRWRASAENPEFDLSELYTNEFVQRAMSELGQPAQGRRAAP